MLDAMTIVYQRHVGGGNGVQESTLSLKNDHTQNHLWHAGSLKGAADPVWAPAFNEAAYGFEESAFYPKARFTSSINIQAFPETGSLGSISGWAAKTVQLIPPATADPTQGILVRINKQAESTPMGVGLLARFNDGRQKELLADAKNQVSTTLVPGWSWADISDLTMVVVNTSTQSTLSGSNEQTLSGLEWLVDAVYLPERGLLLPYPNPFSDQVSIPFYLNAPDEVSMIIYDVTGRRVSQLIKNQSYSDGFHTIEWHPTGLASGVYFIQFSGQGFRDNRAVTLQRNGQ